MDANSIVDGLIMYLGLIVLLTFHEFGHAWMALKCGDDTAKVMGRVSLNPLVHIDPIGTVLMPLLGIFLPSNVGRFIIGWAKPMIKRPTFDGRKIPNSGINTVPIGSMCTSGLSETRPMTFAVSSPHFNAIHAWPNS